VDVYFLANLAVKIYGGGPPLTPFLCYVVVVVKFLTTSPGYKISHNYIFQTLSYDHQTLYIVVQNTTLIIDCTVYRVEFKISVIEGWKL
jgi:hypothetical protein